MGGFDSVSKDGNLLPQEVYTTKTATYCMHFISFTLESLLSAIKKKEQDPFIINISFM